ncbi:hypothetical protein D9M73_249480 [compost metagenome]
MVAQPLARLAHGDDLGVRAGIMTGNVEVPALAQQFAISPHQHRPNRDFIKLTLGTVRECKCVMHPKQVGVATSNRRWFIGHDRRPFAARRSAHEQKARE